MLYERERTCRPPLVPALADYAHAMFAAGRMRVRNECKGDLGLEAARDAGKLAGE